MHGLHKMGDRGGFSLLELLTGVAIVTVILSIIVPVAMNLQRSASATKCASNMRQIGLALNAYAADHDDYFPPVVINPVGWKYWDMDAIWGYAMNSSPASGVNYFTNYKEFIFRCPSGKSVNCSYGMNVMFPDGKKNYYLPRKRSSVSKPSSCMLLGEGTNHAIDSWWYASPPGQPVSFPHGKFNVNSEEAKTHNTANWLFMDLHIEARKAGDIPKGGWGAVETTDAFWTGN